jgi:hypothetical protein
MDGGFGTEAVPKRDAPIAMRSDRRVIVCMLEMRSQCSGFRDAQRRWQSKDQSYYRPNTSLICCIRLVAAAGATTVEQAFLAMTSEAGGALREELVRHSATDAPLGYEIPA